MVRAENVATIRASLAVIMKNNDRVAAQAIKRLIDNAKIYRHCVLDPARDTQEINTCTYTSGESCARDIRSGIHELELRNIHLPDVPMDEFVDTLAQAVGFD